MGKVLKHTKFLSKLTIVAVFTAAISVASLGVPSQAVAQESPAQLQVSNFGPTFDENGKQVRPYARFWVSRAGKAYYLRTSSSQNNLYLGSSRIDSTTTSHPINWQVIAVDNRTYLLKNSSSGKCIWGDISSDGQSATTRMMSCNTSNSHQWLWIRSTVADDIEISNFEWLIWPAQYRTAGLVPVSSSVQEGTLVKFTRTIRSSDPVQWYIWRGANIDDY